MTQDREEMNIDRVKADEINVEEIMEQIRREIKEKGLDKEVLSFEKVPIRKVKTRSRLMDRVLSFGYYKIYLNLPKPLHDALRTAFRKIKGQ